MKPMRWLKLLPAALAVCVWAEAAVAVGEAYRIAPGDVLTIEIFQEPDISLGGVKVDDDGVIPYPLIGDVVAAGRTASELEAELTARLLDGYLRKPHVTVSVSEARPIYVRGEGMAAPRTVRYHEGLTLELALLLAGVDDPAQIEEASIARAGLTEALAVEKSMSILPGDVITVPPAQGGPTGEFIYFHGEVARPGSYAYREGLTVEQAIALAGGFSLRASKRKIKITREGDPPSVIKRAELTAPVEPGDVITVGASLF